MIKELKQLLPGAHPRKILVDFEQAPINAFRAEYPLADILGCYFHLKQSVNRKINDLGLKEMYESNDDFRLYSRCLSALAYVPEDDVGNSFDTLAEIFGELNGSSELISYFEKTYIRGRRNPRQRNNFAAPLYNVRLWNKHNSTLEGVARTTNCVEGWHYGIQSLHQCSHPTLWKFLDGIQKDMQKHKALYLQVVMSKAIAHISCN
ncbi:uncharacterized protein LOC135924680 [Gordionus sp. m RMFG-2023]|uniref:uncharacterized protein LOC135924680 n=1 Tax=Gordionus sp. m RMFG-2023 TaxID=3053472 RepID=UPI0031FE1BA8